MEFRTYIFNYSSVISKKWNDLSQQLFRGLGSRHLTKISLVTILGLSGISWGVISAIAPQSAQAYVARTNVSLDAQLGESFETLLIRAEGVARASAQRLLDSDVLVTEVAITIMGRNQGSVAPILRLQVSRDNWRSQPEANYWATYFVVSEVLLNMQPNETSTAQATSPEPTSTQEIPGVFEIEQNNFSSPSTPPTQILQILKDSETLREEGLPSPPSID